MTKIDSRALATVSFGNPTAEADEMFLFGRGCFIETDVYDACIRLESPQFIVGRRGAGKTALSMALHRAFASQPTILCSKIVPQAAFVAHAKSLAQFLAQSTGVNWEFLFTSLWATTLRSEWSRMLLSFYKVRDSKEGDLAVLTEFVNATCPDQNESASARLSRYIIEIVEILALRGGDVVGSLNVALNSYRSEHIQRSLARIVEASEVRLVTIVDGLDENWDGSNTSAELLSGLLIQAAADYPSIGAITFAFLRENMYRRVSNICPRWDRIEGYFNPLTWTEEQMRELITRRARSQESSDQQSWDSIFEPEVNGISSVDYILRRTQFKPREVILFCKYSVDVANRHRSSKVRSVDILTAERRYSENRLKDLLNEYQDALPELRVVIDLFLGNPQTEAVDEFLRLLDEFISTGSYAQLAPRLSLVYPSREAIFDLLLGVGFIGVKLEGADSFLFKYYGEQGNVFKDIADIHEVSIHPAFEQALGLIGRSQEVPTKEADETDIVAASASIVTRLGSPYEKAAKIIGHLRDIPPGIGGFRRYEDLIQSAIEFSFQSYLDNPRNQERNWAGTQVRDIVFDNTGETLFFRTIRNQYAAVTVPFECKNKMDLEPGDFHQMESRLSDTGGFFGFLCYRSGRREPVRSEIEHLRDINRRDHRKIVMLISDANVVQLITQRTKGHLDRFLFKMYTRYLTLYLA